MPTEPETLRSLIGGRWAVSWQGYLLAWPWAVLFTFSATPALWVSDSLTEGIVRGVVAGTLAYIPVGVVLYIAAITILRKRRDAPVAIALVALVGGLAWTARSLAMLSYLNLHGLPSDVSAGVRLISGFLQGAVAVVLAAWLFATIHRFNERRQELLSELVQEELAAERLSEDIEQMRVGVFSEVQRTVDASVHTLDEQLRKEELSARDVDALATVSQNMSRSLARKLWEGQARAARVNLLTVLRSAVMHRPFAYWGLLPGPLFGFLVLAAYWPWPDTVVALVMVTVFSFLVSAVTNAVAPRLNASRGMVVYLAAIVLLLGSALVMRVTMDLLDLSPPRGDALLWAVAVNFGVFYPLVGIGAHVGRARQEVLDQLRRSIDNAEIRREALSRVEMRVRRDLAYALHGGLQADLTASAIRAQQAIDGGDVLAARETLALARDLISHAIELPERSRTTLQGSVESVIDAWDGMIDITTHIDVPHEPGAHCLTMLQEVLIEGIGNAVRHGSAKALDIEIVEDHSDLRVTITDDGNGAGPSNPGLGSSMFDELAPNAWSLAPAAKGGSTLTVKLRNATM